MGPDDVAVLAWIKNLRCWIFEPGDAGPGECVSPIATQGADPVAAITAYFSQGAAPDMPIAQIGTVDRAMFDRNHIYVLGCVEGLWTCWHFSQQPPSDDCVIRSCDADTPQEALIQCFVEQGALRLQRVQ